MDVLEAKVLVGEAGLGMTVRGTVPSRESPLPLDFHAAVGAVLLVEVLLAPDEDDLALAVRTVDRDRLRERLAVLTELHGVIRWRVRRDWRHDRAKARARLEGSPPRAAKRILSRSDG